MPQTQTAPPQQPTNLQAALALAAQGLFVFPCQSSGPDKKRPCKGVYWRSVSTNDPVKINQLWNQHPDAAPALDLAKCNLLVIDCDKQPADGVIWLQNYAAQHNDPLEPPSVITPSTGRHLYYLNPTQHTNARGNLPPKAECGIDVRGSGGFVIAPGALFTDTNQAYRAQGDILKAMPPPSWLVELISSPLRVHFNEPEAEPPSNVRKDAYGQAALQAIVTELEQAPEGTRNDTAFKLAARAGELVGSGCIDFHTTFDQLIAAARSWGISSRDKVLGPRGTIARGLAVGRQNPKGPTDALAPNVEILLPELTVVQEPPTDNLPTAPPLPAASELPEHLTRPPGLLGEITDWITDTALYPQRGLALGAALTIVGTAAGRHIAGPLRCGTHLYVVGLAPSGAGKNHPLSQIATILNAAGMRQHIGPSQFISMPAVINFLVRAPLAVCAMDEFGSFLKRINSRRASGFEGAISGMLRSLWGSSFAAMATPEWAQKESVTIFSPSLSIFGISTTKEFYDSLEGADITNGVLNRFLLIETKHRPAEREPLKDPSRVPPSITSQIASIYSKAGPLNMLCQSTTYPTFTSLVISPKAEQIRKSLVIELRERGDKDLFLEPFLARTAENALRLATIATIGVGVDCIEEPMMQWGTDFAVWSSNVLASSAGLYIADSETQAMANAVRRALVERGGKASKKDLLRSLSHKYKRRELDDVLTSLAESETIKVVKAKNPKISGPVPTWFLLNKS